MITKALILAAIFLTPLLGATERFGYEQVKVLMFLILTTAAGALWKGVRIRWTLTNEASPPAESWGFHVFGKRLLFLPASSSSTEVRGIRRIENKTAGLFILILLLTSAAGLDPKSSLLGREPYFQGWILYAFLFLFYLLVQQSKIRPEAYALTLSLSALLVSLSALKDWVLLNIFHQSVPVYAGRVVSSFGQPNFYAGFILLAMPFAKGLGRWQYLFWGAGTLAILASKSRAAILLLPVVFLVIWSEKVKKKVFAWAFAGLVSVVFGLSLYLSYLSRAGILWQEIFAPYQQTVKAEANPAGSVEARFFIWPLTWEVIGQKPFLGYGLENMGKSLSHYFAENKHRFFEENLSPSSVLVRLKDLNILRAHNYPLDLLLYSGILGFLAWGFFVCLLIRRARSYTLFVSLILYLIWSAFQNQSVVHLMYFWLLAGLIVRQK